MTPERMAEIRRNHERDDGSDIGPNTRTVDAFKMSHRDRADLLEEVGRLSRAIERLTALDVHAALRAAPHRRIDSTINASDVLYVRDVLLAALEDDHDHG